ncbi:MAG TPA: hypothetical protein VN969_06410 [Streptosporangiaceae bacterium]|jgi:hypothetical protein|nr:hypothetical protein [Streptosporangiaceae bacterium]
MDTRPAGFASDRTDDELQQERQDWGLARSQASPGSLADRLAAAYGHAVAVELDRRNG